MKCQAQTNEWQIGNGAYAVGTQSAAAVVVAPTVVAGIGMPDIDPEVIVIELALVRAVRMEVAACDASALAEAVAEAADADAVSRVVVVDCATTLAATERRARRSECMADKRRIQNRG
ncbi:hypothetical protein HK101_000390 [Irineochytrium annulatum]|nr:hypothetical protein HK101_000390 [Irineochytrium annulatum]